VIDKDVKIFNNTLTKYNTENYKRYRQSVDMLSRKNLKKYKPDLWERWVSHSDMRKNNKMDALTIEHGIPVSEGFDFNIPKEDIAHTDNLTLLTLRENLKKWSDYINIKNYPQSYYVYDYDTEKLIHIGRYGEKLPI